MLFNTIEFVIFLPIVIIAYFLLPYKFRWIFLLAASYYFYMSWKVEYVFLILISTIIDYISGLVMERKSNKKSRLPMLIISLVTNLGFLFSFKYFNFASENIGLLVQKFGLNYDIPIMSLLLPVGISFYTFQSMSYSIDVYLGKQKAEKHFGYFALYVSFFPQLVAGPIERFSRLNPQLRAEHSFSYSNLANGLRLILYGLFIKMVIADNISGAVDQVYASPEIYNTLDILGAMFLYSFQIYSDFYGYSLIAIGSALIMGIKIMDNFKTPYLAKSISEFWQRWHISLSTWFRDYLYYPLGGNRVKMFRWIFNILVVFIVSGFWHGANWTFLVWGALFGLFYLAENSINRLFGLSKNYEAYSFGHILLALKTFLFVTIIWVFFRSQSIDEAMSIFRLLFVNYGIESAALSIQTSTWIFLSIFVVSDILLYNKRFDTWIDQFPAAFRWSIYSILIFFIIVFAGIEDAPFIYFQF